jgi:hypothetical protein
MKTTLNKIRAYNPCKEGWEKLLRGLGKSAADDEPLWIDQVLDINGLDDALWCLQAVEGCDREIRLYAVWCARRVQHLMSDPRSIVALDVAERYARGEASDKELAEAAKAAKAAMAAAARSAKAAMAAEVAEVAAARFAKAAAMAAEAAARSAEAAELVLLVSAWAAWAAWAATKDAERDAQAEELRRVCREMGENGR